MKPVGRKRWTTEYAFHPFKVRTTDKEFVFSRRSSISVSTKVKGSNTSAVFTPRMQETLINGVLQGRKQCDVKGGSILCNERMWEVVFEVAVFLRIPVLNNVLQRSIYSKVKDAEAFEDRRHVKSDTRSLALKGWIPNSGDDFEVQHV